MLKKTIVGIIGQNKDSCTPEMFEYGIELGKYLIDKNYFIVCGGKFGIMEAVCKGAHTSEKYEFGCTIGILPEENKTSANKYIDITVPSGIGIARNTIIINTADIIIAIGGGAGTLSEIAFAWQKNVSVLCNISFKGWAKELASKDLDNRKTGLLIPFKEIKNINSLIKSYL